MFLSIWAQNCISNSGSVSFFFTIHTSHTLSKHNCTSDHILSIKLKLLAVDILPQCCPKLDSLQHYWSNLQHNKRNECQCVAKDYLSLVYEIYLVCRVSKLRCYNLQEPNTITNFANTLLIKHMITISIVYIVLNLFTLCSRDSFKKRKEKKRKQKRKERKICVFNLCSPV